MPKQSKLKNSAQKVKNKMVENGEKSSKKGFWIAFEGNDGAGKTYQLSRFAQFLKGIGHKVVETREPGGNEYSEQLRKLIFSDKVAEDPKTQLLLFTAARRRNILETVLPAIGRGEVVLSDRSEGSSFAYQHFQFGIPFELVQFVNQFATDGVKPDLTVFLDVSEEIGLRRVSEAKGGEANHFDKASKEQWRKRQEGFRRLVAINKDWVEVDANKERDEVYEQILYTVARKGLI